MPQLDGLKEESVYLRLWLGNRRGGDKPDRLVRFGAWHRNFPVVVARHCRHDVTYIEHRSPPSTDRPPHRGRSEPLGMDIVLGIIIVAVALLFLGIAVDLTRRK